VVAPGEGRSIFRSSGRSVPPRYDFEGENRESGQAPTGGSPNSRGDPRRRCSRRSSSTWRICLSKMVLVLRVTASAPGGQLSTVKMVLRIGNNGAGGLNSPAAYDIQPGDFKFGGQAG